MRVEWITEVEDFTEGRIGHQLCTWKKEKSWHMNANVKQDDDV